MMIISGALLMGGIFVGFAGAVGAANATSEDVSLAGMVFLVTQVASISMMTASNILAQEAQPDD